MSLAGMYYLHDHEDGKFITGQVLRELAPTYYLLSVDDATGNGFPTPYEVHDLKKFATEQDFRVEWLFFRDREHLETWITHIDKEIDTKVVKLKEVPNGK